MPNEQNLVKDKWFAEKGWERLNGLLIGIIALITIALICMISFKISVSNDQAMRMNAFISASLMSGVLLFVAIIYSAIQCFIGKSSLIIEKDLLQ